METISPLARLRGALTGTIRIDTGAIPADIFDFWVIAEPFCHRCSCAVWQKIHHFTSFQINDNRPVSRSLPPGLSNPSAIVSDPIDSQAIVSAIKRYNAKNIPVAIIDTPAAAGADVAITVSFDNYIGGQTAAQEIIKRLVEKYGEPKGTVLNCFGALQSVAWRLRKEGMDAEFAKYPNINYLARPTEGALDQMMSVTLSTLSEFPDLDAVHAPSDSPSRGIVTALTQKDRWKKIGEEGHVIFVNIDGEPVALNWIKEGYMDACVSQDPIAYGEIAVELLSKHSMKGEAVPLGTYENKKYFWEKSEIVAGDAGPTMIIPPFIIDPTNATDERHWGHVAEEVWGIPYT